MRVFFVDFENVHSEGMVGIECLTENDEVVIFYSVNADTISFEILHKLMLCKAKLNYYKIRRGGKNALDFQLSTFLGYRIRNDADKDFYIISKDCGFDFVLDFWALGHAECKVNVRRFVAIKNVLNWLDLQSRQKIEVKSEAEKAVLNLIVTSENSENLQDSLITAESDAFLPEITPVSSRRIGILKPIKTAKTTSPANTDEIEKIPKRTYSRRKITENSEVAEAIEINEDDLIKIEEYFPQSKKSHELYIHSVKLFGQKKGQDVYRAIKDKYVAYAKTHASELCE